MKPTKAIQERNACMKADRARGLTIREIAARYGLGKSRVHALVKNVPIAPPPAGIKHELVRLPTGGYTSRITAAPPARPRVYWVRDGRRVYPGDENFPKNSEQTSMLI